MTRERWGVLAMCAGLMLFGIAVGGVAGLSKTPVAAGLLTSVFGFVGGVLLSFAGFSVVDAKAGERARVNTLQMGVALAAFSLGLSGGVLGGILLRIHHPFIVDAPAEAIADSKTAPGSKSSPEKKVSIPSFSLEADKEQLCASVQEEIRGAQYAAAPALATHRVAEFHDLLCAPKQ